LDRYKDLEKQITQVQNLRKVDDREIKDLIAQVKAAHTAERGLEQSKAQMGQDLNRDIAASMARVDQLTQELEKFKEIGQKVSALEPLVTDVIAPKIQRLETDSLDTDAAVGELEHTVDKLNTALSARQAILRGADPRAIAQKVTQQGVIKR
jgi:SMC interacting uncharacterized protein involved in chromosome segregation